VEGADIDASIEVKLGECVSDADVRAVGEGFEGFEDEKRATEVDVSSEAESRRFLVRVCVPVDTTALRDFLSLEMKVTSPPLPLWLTSMFCSWASSSASALSTEAAAGTIRGGGTVVISRGALPVMSPIELMRFVLLGRSAGPGDWLKDVWGVIPKDDP